MYFSAASRTTQASETFFASAIRSSSLYTPVGKLTEARVILGEAESPRALFSCFITSRYSWCTTLHHNGAFGQQNYLLTGSSVAVHYRRRTYRGSEAPNKKYLGSN